MPQFPASASEAGIQGLVSVIVEFNEQGEVTRVALNKQASKFARTTREQLLYETNPDSRPRGPFITDQRLFDAVSTAVRQWKTRKLERETDPLMLRSELTFNFIIENGQGRVEEGPEGAAHYGISDGLFDEKDKASSTPF